MGLYISTHFGLVLFYDGIHHSPKVFAQLWCDLCDVLRMIRKLKVQTSFNPPNWYTQNVFLI
jgi:hypothetical protein